MLVIGFFSFISIDGAFVLDHGQGKWDPILKPYINLLKFNHIVYRCVSYCPNIWLTKLPRAFFHCISNMFLMLKKPSHL